MRSGFSVTRCLDLTFPRSLARTRSPCSIFSRPGAFDTLSIILLPSSSHLFLAVYIGGASDAAQIIFILDLLIVNPDTRIGDRPPKAHPSATDQARPLALPNSG